MSSNGFNAAGVNNPVCTLCGKNSENKCDRCGDFYCSEVCQQRDWASHRFICFPMPKLVKALDMSMQLPGKNLQTLHIKEEDNYAQLPNGSCVLVTAFKSSNQCFIRPTNPCAIAEYTKILDQINDFGKKSSALTEKPKNDSWALALRDGKWCRGKIISFQKGQCRISYLDFGELGKSDLKNLRKIEQHLIDLPCFIHEVKLKGIAHLMAETSFMKCLTQYTNKEYKIVYAQPDKYHGDVELYQWRTNILLNSLINNLFAKPKDDINKLPSTTLSSSDIQNNGKSDKSDLVTKSTKNANGKINNRITSTEIEAKNISNSGITIPAPSEKKMAPAAPRQIQKPCLIPPFEIIPLCEDDINSKILIMDNSYIESGFIGCLLEKYSENLKLISKFLNEHTVGQQSYKPKLNEYCLANYETEWYRAKVVEILSEDTFLVTYIDFTNEKELTSKFIRRYPTSLNLPCYTTLCAIDGLPDDKSDKLKNFLESNCAAFQFLNIDGVRIEDDVRYIKSTELLTKMRDANLL